MAFFRSKKGISVPELAEILDIKYTITITDWEKGKRLPRLKKMIQLSRALEQPISNFIEMKNEKMKHYNVSVFAVNLQKQRTKICFTQEQVVKKLRCRICSIYRWENGKNMPSFNSTWKLSQILECSIDDFFLSTQHENEE